MTLWEIKYAFICALSWLSLLSERLWRSYWPAFSLLFAFIGLASLGALTFFGQAAHLVFLAGFFGAFIYFIVRPRFAFRLPRPAHIRRAVERQSGLSHRPLEALTDRPAIGTTPEAIALWEKYQNRLRRYRSKLKVYRPASGVATRDRYALRHAALLLLVIGLFVAQGETGFRLLNALHVDTSKWIKSTPIALDIWITPPVYTGMSPVFLATTQIGTTPDTTKIRVPENSLLKIRVSGFADAPHISLGNTQPVFTHPAARSYALDMKLSKSGTLKLTQGFFHRSLGTWPVIVLPDHPPDVTLISTEKTNQGALKINYSAKDDYGLKTITGTITPSAKIARALNAGALDFKIPVSSNDDNLYAHVEDLTANPFAGSEVTLTLTVTDDAANKTVSAPLTVALPERIFTNPVAKRIAAERKRLIWYNNALSQKLVAHNLAEIANQPLGYHGDTSVFLGLAVAVKRLNYEGRDQEAVRSLIPLLWDLALKVEDGGLSMAGRDLSDALQRLSEGLKNKDLSKAEINALMDDVRQKMRQYVKTLASEMHNRLQSGKDIPTLSPELAKKFMKHIDMGKMLKEMQQLSQGGSREQMQKMAEYLKKSVDNLDLNRMAQMQESQKEQIKALNDLQKLIERQQSLLDKTNMMPQSADAHKKNQEQQQRAQAQKNQDQNQQSQQQKDTAQQNQETQGKNPQDSQNGQSQKSPDGAPQQAQQGQPQSAQQGNQQSQTKGQKQGQKQGGQQTSQSMGQMPPQPSPTQSAQQGQEQTSQQGDKQGDGQGHKKGPHQTAQSSTQSGQKNMPPQPSPAAAGKQSAQQGQQGQEQQGQSQGTKLGQNGMPLSIPGMEGQPIPDPQGQKGQKEQMGQTGQQQNGTQGSGKNGQQPPTPQQSANGQKGGKTGEGAGGTQKNKKMAGAGGTEGDNNDKPPQDISTPQEGAAEQKTIRGKLGSIMRALGENIPEVPANFGKSDQAMESAQKSLGNGAPRDSAPAQKEALDQLQQGLDKTMESMAKRMQQAVMTFGDGGGAGGFGEGYDPLGRQMGNRDDNGNAGQRDIELPDGKERRRVQQIIQELRARSNDYTRPKVERDYIDRLLDQFN